MVTLTEQNNKYLLQLIDGLTYNVERNEYTFNGKRYLLRKIQSITSQKSVYYFTNKINSTDLVQVVVRKDIPLIDGFNKVEIDSTARKQCYQSSYYEKVTVDKRKQLNEEKRLAKLEEAKQRRLKHREAEKKAKEEARKAREEAMKEVPCAFCGNIFKQKQKHQKFCSRKCYQKFHEKEQAEALKKANYSNKNCLICGKEFSGTKKQIYCSVECRQKHANSIPRNRKKND